MCKTCERNKRRTYGNKNTFSNPPTVPAHIRSYMPMTGRSSSEISILSKTGHGFATEWIISFDFICQTSDKRPFYTNDKPMCTSEYRIYVVFIIAIRCVVDVSHLQNTAVSYDNAVWFFVLFDWQNYRLPFTTNNLYGYWVFYIDL